MFNLLNVARQVVRFYYWTLDKDPSPPLSSCLLRKRHPFPFDYSIPFCVQLLSGRTPFDQTTNVERLSRPYRRRYKFLRVR